MARTDPVNLDRFARLERMLLEKRRALVESLTRQFGEQLGGDAQATLDETIEVGDRSVLVHEEDVELGVVEMRRRELRQIDDALRRLRAGDYGRCEDCDAEIEEERLEVLPFASLCVDCKRRREASERAVEATGRGFRSGFRDLREPDLETEPGDE
jgi:DnaK suppressor protein